MNFPHARSLSARRAAVSVFAVAASLGALATPANAQDTATDEQADREIVVTGTLLRGVAPGGSNVVALSQEQIQGSGVQTTAQLLATIPQLGSFGTTVAPLGIGGINVNRPNLRNLPGFNTGGSSTTLVLLDGHRVVGMGNISTTPDPDFIPPGAIQRVDVVPDGGSAIYGSDAVAGVMNFITRRDFDGIEANARYGVGDDYYTLDLNGTVGKKWDGGSAFISYAFSRHDGIFGRDRDFVRRFATTVLPGTPYGPVTSLNCYPGNVQVGSTIYGLPYTTATAAAAAGRLNTCDTSDQATLIGPDRRHSVMAGLEQELTSNLSVSLRANYFDRRMATVNGPLTSTSTVGSGALGFAQHRIGTETSQSVYFQYGGAEQARSDFELETWGVNAEFTYNPGGDWRVKLLGNYGQSHATELARSVDGNALTRAINGGLFNAYDWQASNPAALAALFNYGTVNDARQRLVNFKAVADGSLFALPGGNVKLAFGGEFIHEGFDVRNGTGIPGQILSGSPAISVGGVTVLNAIAPTRNRFNLSRDVKAVFGELSIPVFGADNEMALFRSLSLSASGRYDDYGGAVGGTFNPKFGFNWKPVEGIRFRGAWGKAFNAPSLADYSGATLSSVVAGGQLGSLTATNAGRPPAEVLAIHPIGDGRQTVLTINGNAPGIQPQSGTTLSLGVDLDPTFVPGLHVGVTYWSIHMKDLIQRAPTTDQIQWWVRNPDKFVFNPSAAQILNVINSFAQTGAPNTICPPPNPISSSPDLATQAGANCVYAIADARKTNFGKVNVSGLDFDVSYRHDTSFGSIDASWNASLELDRKQSAGRGAPFFPVLNNNDFRFTSTLGANVGDLRAQVTWNYRQGYALSPAPAIPGTSSTQSRLPDYSLFNLFFKYDVNGENLFKDLSFTLNVDNVFDKDPPTSYNFAFIGGQAGYGNGFTLGRVFTFGVSKKF